MKPTVDAIDALLPQTQCARCSYDGCLPYAEAIHAGAADINQCPPGGDTTIAHLAQLLGTEIKPLNPEHGSETAVPIIALIDEPLCIGCFKCVLVCPVDAIVGAPQQMHTVIASDCSGCELCLPVCPTDCITLVPRTPQLPTPTQMAPRWRRLHRARGTRLQRAQQALDQQRLQRRTAALKAQAESVDIHAAIERARARRRTPPNSA